MSKRVSLNEKMGVKKAPKTQVSNPLFKKTEEDPTKELVKSTYYLTAELNEALNIAKAFDGTDKSENIRKALYSYLDKEYLKMAKKKIEEESK